jgi:hypothetical protein
MMLRPRTALAASAVLLAGGVSVLMTTLAAPAAFADSQKYELYCPGTPVGNIVLNDVVTTGTISPASPASGQQFNLTNYQVQVNVPQSLVAAAAALGNTAIAGTAVAQVDATGATPASIPSGTLQINYPIPSPVPPNGLQLALPTPPSTIGPFTASGGAISLTVDPKATLTLQVSGNPLNLTCTAYPNNTAPSGISSSSPSASSISPVIATASAGGGGGGGGTTATTAPPTAASSSSSAAAPTTQAFTGPGPHLWLVALIGAILLLFGTASVLLAEGPRMRLRRAFRMAAPGQAATVAAPPRQDRRDGLRGEDASVPAAQSGAPQSRHSTLWIGGWEPEVRSSPLGPRGLWMRPGERSDYLATARC